MGTISSKVNKSVEVREEEADDNLRRGNWTALREPPASRDSLTSLPKSSSVQYHYITGTITSTSFSSVWSV